MDSLENNEGPNWSLLPRELHGAPSTSAALAAALPAAAATPQGVKPRKKAIRWCLGNHGERMDMKKKVEVNVIDELVNKKLSWNNLK